MEIHRVSLIAPKPTVPLGASHYLIMLLWGLPLLGTLLKKRGYDVRVFFEIVKPIDWDYVYGSQVVGFQMLACTAHRTFDFIKRIKANNPQAVTVIGDTVPTAVPEDVLQYCDFVVRQEGDETLPDLLDALRAGRDLRRVPGISYRINETKVRHNPDRALVKDIDTIPDLSLVHGWRELNRWNMLLRGRQMMHVVQTSRGCPFKCSFCIVPMMYNPATYRVRSIDSVIEEIKGKIADTGCRRFMFVDNYFGANRPHAKALLRRIIEERIRFTCFAFCRLEIYKDSEFLTLLKQAGFDPLFIGFESFSDDTLQSFDKRQTAARVIEAIAAIKAAGLRISGSFIIGSDDDTVDRIRATIASAIRYGIDNINIFMLGVVPGRGPQPLPRNRLILLDYDFCSGNHVTVFPKQMKPSTLQKEYIRAYRQFNNVAHALQAIKHGDLMAGLERFLAYVAHRSIIGDIERRYLPLLYQVEEGLYDEHERLLEEKLPPHGVVGKGIILPPEEKALDDATLEQESELKKDDLLYQPMEGSFGAMTLPGMVRGHTLEMALRKCYGNQLNQQDKVVAG
jgi:anaerobic magnesium-protoporphyrin IX monomethyl ester cyclase